jgi:hypothetical protein
MIQGYFAIGTTLAGMVNVGTLLSTEPIYVPPDGRVPLVGSVNKRANGKLLRDGFKNGRWVTITEQEELNTFLLSIFGSYTLDYKSLYVSTLDETGHYSPYLCNFERPSTVDETMVQTTGGVYLSPTVFNLSDCILQTLTKTANYTVTTSDRFIYANTASGSITFALPAVAGVVINTVYSFIKTSASNSMILDGNGGELVAGAATLTKTALNARVDIYSDGAKWLTV